MFPLSLFGSAFSWFTALPVGSIQCWEDMEKQFHKYFFAGVYEMRLTDLTALKQRNEESVAEFVQRLRGVQSRCFSLNLSDAQLTELAFQGMTAPVKERFTGQEFESLAHLVQWLSAHESRYLEIHRDRFSKRVA